MGNWCNAIAPKCVQTLLRILTIMAVLVMIIFATVNTSAAGGTSQTHLY